jgi:hypothetical protein
VRENGKKCRRERAQCSRQAGTPPTPARTATRIWLGRGSTAMHLFSSVSFPPDLACGYRRTAGTARRNSQPLPQGPGRAAGAGSEAAAMGPRPAQRRARGTTATASSPHPALISSRFLVRRVLCSLAGAGGACLRLDHVVARSD